jgi:hypothetical protein
MYSALTNCSKCKKPFEEINLTWVQVKGKMIVHCDGCAKQTKDSEQGVGPRNLARK